MSVTPITPTSVDDNQLLPAIQAEAINVIGQGQRRLRGLPSVAQIGAAVVDVQVNGSVKQISNIVVTLHDPGNRLLVSGFLDADENSEIDPIDINFPRGSEYWWRLTIVSPSRADGTLALTFLARPVVLLMSKVKHALLSNRAKMTRAEFLALCVADCCRTEGCAISFLSRELDVRQRVAPPGAKTMVDDVTAATTVSKTAEPYVFKLPQSSLYWDQMRALAARVKWLLWVDGDRVYYDSEQTLIRQVPAATVTLGDDVIADFSFDWDAHAICTQVTLQLFDRPWQFQPGQVLQLAGFGPASEGSTASPQRLPGAWLIQDSQRNGTDEATTYTLVQPDLPKMEPQPQIKTQTVSSGMAKLNPLTTKGSIATGQVQPRTVEAVYVAAQYLASRELVYSEGVRTLIKDPPRMATMYDCSASTAWILLAAGFPLPGGVTWGEWAPVSGDFMPGQAGLLAGPGRWMTIYARADYHVFVHVHPPGAQDMQANTVSPPVNMRGFDFFPWSYPGCGGDGGPSPASYFTLSHFEGS